MPNSYYTTYNLSAVDFVCSNYSYYLSDCSFTATSDYSCQSHDYDAYLTCAIGMGYTSQRGKISTISQHPWQYDTTCFQIYMICSDT